MKTATSEKRRRLEAMLKNGCGNFATGATPSEKETAKKLLGGLTGGSPPDKIRVWKAEGRLKSGTLIVHGAALQYFCRHVRSGAEIDYLTVPYSKIYRAGDFRAITQWLIDLSLCVRTGRKYVIGSMVAIKAAWEKLVDSIRS